jgi:hypothetical protein
MGMGNELRAAGVVGDIDARLAGTIEVSDECHAGHDITLGTNMAEYLNALVTLCAAIIAYRAYVSTTNDNRSKHVHELFKEYLKARMEIERDHEEFIGFKLYVLEEAYHWVKKIKRAADRNRWLITSSAYDEQRAFCKAWLETIDVHLKFEPADMLAAISEYESCYAPSFVSFARKALSSAEHKG